MKKLDLCGACAAKMETGFSVHKVAGGVDQKVICKECGRRRYGGTFEISPKKKTSGVTTDGN